MASKKNKDQDITLKEAASKLDISEPTVRKYMRDFKLDTVKGDGNKSVISYETLQALTEIARLRANGLSIQEIKELKGEKPSRTMLDEVEDGGIEIENKNEEESKTEDKKDKKDKKDENEKSETIEEKIISAEESSEELTRNIEGNDDIEEPIENEIEESDTVEEIIETEDGQRRRRTFNYRYVERQISNDSKRIGSLRQRLRNPNLPVQDRLFFEEALERRILFLDGWKHILRWTSMASRD